MGPESPVNPDKAACFQMQIDPFLMVDTVVA